jgi:glycosyltransferase involved in cell wall biosynthesis
MESRLKLRIGYYDDSRVKGGTTRYLFDLIDGLDRDVFEPVFFAPANSCWHEDLRRLAVKVITPADAPGASTALVPQPAISGGPGKRRIRLPRSLAWHLGLAGELKQAYKLFRSEPVDLFHSNNVGAEVAPIAARWTGKPVVGTLHVDPTYDLFGERSSWRYRNLEKWCLRSVDHAIAVSQSTRDLWGVRCELPGAYRSTRMSVIRNGIEPKRFTRRHNPQVAKRRLNLPGDAFVLVSLGRLEPAKGYEDLIRALPAIAYSVPSVELVIGGQGFLKENLLQLAESLGVRERLHFPGFMNDVRDLLEAADLYVQPSLCETLGYGLLEALAMSLPAVITKVGGMAEVVESGSNGLAVPVNNPEALAAAVIRLANDCPTRLHFGVAGRMRVESAFSIATMREQTFELYGRVVKSDARRTSSAVAS